MREFLVDNIFVVFAGKVFQQIVGFPMGTNCAPLQADIFLFSYEAEFIYSLCSQPAENNWHLGSISHISTSMMFCLKTTQSLRITWAKCNPLNLRSTRQRAPRLSNKLLEQGYAEERLKSSLKKLYGR